MKILTKKEQVFDYFVEDYYLNSVYAGQNEKINIGVLLLFLLCDQPNVDVINIKAEAESEELGVPHNIVSIGAESYYASYKSVEELSVAFEKEEILNWTLKCLIENAIVEFSGNVYDMRIGVSYKIENPVNVIPILYKVETETFNYCEYDFEMLEKMKHWFKLNQKTAIMSLITLEKYDDINQEFCKGMQGSQFVFPKENAISVEGYTAEILNKNFPLSELGAYNYLIYLREKPKEAIDNLKKGLPRK